jgi:transposase InsO family protein
MPAATRPNEHWSMDFVSARTTDGRWFRTLTVLDHGRRRCDGDQPPERDDTEQLQHLPQSRPTARPAARASKWKTVVIDETSFRFTHRPDPHREENERNNSGDVTSRNW